MTTKPKPCPFCGGEADYNNVGLCDRVQCQQCRAATDGYSTKEQAIAAWNHRTPDWISVEDRLPKRNCHVLYCTVRSSGEQFVGEGYLTDDDEWRCNRGRSFPAEMTGAVTHWQPLPEPPEEMREER